MKFIIALALIFFSINIYSQQNFDFKILYNISATRTTGTTNFLKSFSNSTDYLLPITTASIALMGILKKNNHDKHQAIQLAGAQVVALGAGLMLKEIIKRQRPFVKDKNFLSAIPESGYSFPSNHTSFAFATATSLSLSYPKWYVIVPSFAYCSAIAYSRMYLGVHYPTDVLAGALLGAGCGYLSYKINRWMGKRKKAI